MAVTSKSSKEKNEAKTPAKKIEMVNTGFDAVIVKRMDKVRQKMGLPYLQDVVRLSVSSFLEKSGY